MKLNTMQEHQHSDSILLKEAIQFLTGKRCQVNLYLDSSAARGRKLRVCSLLFSATSGISERPLFRKGFRNRCRNSAAAKSRNSHVSGPHEC